MARQACLRSCNGAPDETGHDSLRALGHGKRSGVQSALGTPGGIRGIHGTPGALPCFYTLRRAKCAPHIHEFLSLSSRGVSTTPMGSGPFDPRRGLLTGLCDGLSPDGSDSS